MVQFGGPSEAVFNIRHSLDLRFSLFFKMLLMVKDLSSMKNSVR